MIVYVVSYLVLLVLLFLLFAVDYSEGQNHIDKDVLRELFVFLFVIGLGAALVLHYLGAPWDWWLLLLTIVTFLMIYILATFIRWRMTGSAKLLGVSITNGIVLTVFVCLLILATPFYANEYALCFPCSIGELLGGFLKFVKSFVKGAHFAIMAMTSGVLAQKPGRAYDILQFYYAKGILYLPYYILFGFVVSIAPLSTVTALASLLSEKVSSSLRLSVVAFNKKIIFYDSSVENLYIARCLKVDKNAIRFVFCRSSADELDQAPDRKSMIREVWGICLPDAETDHRFKGDNIYLLSTDNLSIAYEYIKRLTSISDRVDKILVLANDAEDRIKTVEFADTEKKFENIIEFFSFWETMSRKMYKDMSNDAILFILGDEGLQQAFLSRMIKECEEAGDNRKKLQLVVFSSSEREYRMLSLMKEKEYKQFELQVVKPVGAQGYADSRLNNYIEKYEPEKERFIVLISENCEKNLDLKRYVSRQYGKRVKNGDLTIMTYCDNPIMQKQEENVDKLILGQYFENKDNIDTSNMIRYYGVKETLIDDIIDEDKWKKAVNNSST